MNIVLDESHCRENLFPFTLTRHTAQLFIGTCTILEKWKQLTQIPIKLDMAFSDAQSIFIPANVIPTLENVEQLIQFAREGKDLNDSTNLLFINFPWQLYQLNEKILSYEYPSFPKNKQAATLPKGVSLVNETNIFIESGAEIFSCFINATEGPIIISKGAKILDGACLRGPLFIGENSIVKMGAKIYGATSIGSNCMVGGEIKNSVIFDNSNKAHDGYLGNAVIGSWCNLGAGTSNSNVKNTAMDIKFKIAANRDAMGAGIKAGLLMGDYSRAAINTRFNSGTVVGVCCNIFMDVFHKNYIDNFSWNNEDYIFEKAIRDINNWMEMKGNILTDEQISNLKNIYQAKYK